MHVMGGQHGQIGRRQAPLRKGAARESAVADRPPLEHTNGPLESFPTFVSKLNPFRQSPSAISSLIGMLRTFLVDYQDSMCGRFWRRGVPVVDPVISAVYNVTLGVTGNLLFASGTVCASANVCKSAHGASVLPHVAKFESRRFWQFCRAPTGRWSVKESSSRFTFRARRTSRSTKHERRKERPSWRTTIGRRTPTLRTR